MLDGDCMAGAGSTRHRPTGTVRRATAPRRPGSERTKAERRADPDVQPATQPGHVSELVDRLPDPERIVADVETLKAISDPLRLRILETMVTRVERGWSVKELAAALAVPQTRLYHHVELLVERDLLRPVEQRVVSGIIETRYRVAALSLRLDHRLMSGEGALHDAARDLLHSVFDEAREEVGRALHAFLEASADRGTDGPADPGASLDGQDPAASLDADDRRTDKPILHRGLARVSPARAAEFRSRLTELLRDFDTDGDAPDAEAWGFLVALYRVPPHRGPASDD